MIAEGVKLSQTLRRSTHFMKITGRYAMTNIRDMIREVERRAEKIYFMCDIKDTLFYNLSHKLWRMGESRYWVANVDYYHRYMLDLYRHMDNQIWQIAEYEVYGFAMAHRNNCHFILRFRTQARFNGTRSGGDSADLIAGTRRQDSFQARMKANIRQLLRWLLPWIWC